MAELHIECHFVTSLEVARIAQLHHKEGGEMHICDGQLICQYSLIPSTILLALYERAREGQCVLPGGDDAHL